MINIQLHPGMIYMSIVIAILLIISVYQISKTNAILSEMRQIAKSIRNRL